MALAKDTLVVALVVFASNFCGFSLAPDHMTQHFCHVTLAPKEPFATSNSINNGGSKFLRKPGKFACCRPPRKVGAPSYGESWIQKCLSTPYLDKNIAKFSHVPQH